MKLFWEAPPGVAEMPPGWSRLRNPVVWGDVTRNTAKTVTIRIERAKIIPRIRVAID